MPCANWGWLEKTRADFGGKAAKISALIEEVPLPLRLKSLELQGYKTFANRTRFEFGERITAIVGPNGSGKSNIADALRWVLGEQAYSALRARRTEDMIFAGSEHRPRAGMAQVTVLFDNSDGWLPVDFSEVSLTRRAYRDGENEYLLNGQRVRLRNVNELLARAGLADRTYTFIAQGVVDASLSLSAVERRAMLEEAAGVGLYRSRREETLRRLETTRRNLDRVLDILAELDPRLRSLSRQAQRAREYEQVQADLRLMLRDWYGYHWHRTQKQLLDARHWAEAQARRLEEARQKAQQWRAKVRQERQRLEALRQQISAWHRELAALHAQREEQSKALAVAQERLRTAQAQQRDLHLESDRLTEEIRLQEEHVAQAQAEMEAHEKQLAEARHALQEAQTALQDRREERRRWQEELHTARQSLERLERRRTGLAAQQDALQGEAQRLAEDLSRTEDLLAQLTEQQRRTRQQLAQAQQAAQAAAQALAQAQQAVEARQKEVQAAEQALREARQALDALAAEKEQRQARLEVLDQAEQALSGYAEGTRWLLEAVRRGKTRGKGSPLGPHLTVPAEFETAIAAALDRFAEAVLWEGDPEDALRALSEAPGRAALLPLDALRPPQPLTAPDDPDCVGVASQLVEAPPALREAVTLVLGRALVVRHWETARRLVKALPPDALIVTLQGEVFLATGAVLAGKPGAQGVLRRTRERRRLQVRLEQLAREAAAQQEAVSQATRRLRQAQQALQEAQQQAHAQAQSQQNAAREALQEAQLAHERLEQQKALHQKRLEDLRASLNRVQEKREALEQQARQAEERLQVTRQALQEAQRTLAALNLDELHEQVNHWRTQVAVAEQALAHRRSRLQSETQALTRLRQRLATLAQQRETLEETIAQRQADILRAQEALRTFDERVEAIHRQLTPAESEQKRLEEALTQWEAEEAQAAHAYRIAEKHHTQAQLALTRQQEALENLRRRIEEDLGLVMLAYEEDIAGPQPLPIEGLVEQLPVVESIPADLEEQIRQLRARLRRLGPINPEAQTEYEEVQQRHTFLTQQLTDLQKAEADLRQVIAELDDLMEQAFRRTFEQVNGEFKHIFTQLFGGGTASLVLTHPEDIHQSGVDVMVRLPGKRTQALAMLSGGERSLTAVALIFALLRASPTPFCVLDEVDAMLDEANVGRFRELLEDLSEHTQFVIITHNRNTIQAAEVIYGVTMGEDSVSRVISLRLDEVEDMIRE